MTTLNALTPNMMERVRYGNPLTDEELLVAYQHLEALLYPLR